MSEGDLRKNILKGFLDGALKKFKIMDYAEAIFITGSHGRKTNDKFSDIDLVIVVRDKKKLFLSGKFLIEDKVFDFRTEEIKKMKGPWNDDMYFAYLNSILIFDRTNSLKKIILKKKKEFLKSLRDRMIIESVNLSTLFCFKDGWRNLGSEETHLSKSFDRGRIGTIAYIENLIFEKMINLLYWSHDQPIPDSKNRLFPLGALIPPKEYKKLVQLLKIDKLNKTFLLKRYKAISKSMDFVKFCVDRKISPDLDFRKIYFEKRK
jgi:predicted nucleotidyltransferase